MKNAGRFDTQITIEQRTATQESTLGTFSYAWATFATVWAEVQDMLPSRAERIAEGIALQMRPVRVRLRYRSDVTGEMRVVIGGVTYRIVGGPAELGRREGLELVCEVLSTQGVEP